MKLMGSCPSYMVVLPRIEMYVVNTVSPTCPNNCGSKALGKSGFVIDATSCEGLGFAIGRM
jgi:hypothetical protein